MDIAFYFQLFPIYSKKFQMQAQKQIFSKKISKKDAGTGQEQK
jgi:hypothetical protein